MIRVDLGRVWASDVLSQKVAPTDAKYLLGWEPEIPTYQMLNWLQNRIDLALLSLAERGVFEWGTDVSYKAGALAWDETNSVIYVSLRAVVGGATPSVNTTDWARSSSQISLASILAIEAKIDAHIAHTDNPHGVTADQADTYVTTTIDTKIAVNATAILAHEDRRNNPHVVTAAQAGAVPVTGGTFTGVVTHSAAVTSFNSGNTPLPSAMEAPVAGGIRISYGSAWVGLDSDGSAAYYDGGDTYQLIDESTFQDIKTAAEPLYAVPTPYFYWPLVSDIHVYSGSGMVAYEGPTKNEVGLDGVGKTFVVDEPAFGPDGYYANHTDFGYTAAAKLSANGVGLPNMDSDFTVSVFLHQVRVPPGAARVIGFAGTVNTELYMSVGPSGDFYWSINTPSGYNYMPYPGVSVSNANGAFVFRKVGGTVSLFHNGAILAVYTGAQTSSKVVTSLRVGSEGTTRGITADINSIRVWHTALSDEQISTI